MTPKALDRRCQVIRFFASQGGTVSGVKMPDLSVAIGIQHDVLKDDLHRLRDLGVIEVTVIPGKRGEGRKPNEYRLRMGERAFRAQADALERALINKRAAATRDMRKLEEERVRNRMEHRERLAVNAKRRRGRRKVGLPPEEPEAGEREPKTHAVSEALLRDRINEGLTLPASELSKWGA